MLLERMRKRLAADRASFIEPSLPSPADKPPSGSSWIHEIKHDGFRLMARARSGYPADYPGWS
jgi:bifunctional non-homologous end joining protein LigD